MRKHIKREEGTPRAGKTIPLVITRLVEARRSVAANDPHPGKQNYLGKSKKPVPVQTLGDPREERRTPAKGMFIGDGERLTAFVWLDEDDASSPNAAND